MCSFPISGRLSEGTQLKKKQWGMGQEKIWEQGSGMELCKENSGLSDY